MLDKNSVEAIEFVLKKGDRVEIIPLKNNEVKILHIKREAVKIDGKSRK